MEYDHFLLLKCSFFGSGYRQVCCRGHWRSQGIRTVSPTSQCHRGTTHEGKTQ